MELTQTLSLASSVRLKQTNLRPFYKKGGCQRTSHSTFHSRPGWNARLQDEAKRKKSQKHQGTTFREEAKYTRMCKCPQLPWHSWRATLPNPRPRRRRQGPCTSLQRITTERAQGNRADIGRDEDEWARRTTFTSPNVYEAALGTIRTLSNSRKQCIPQN